MFIDQRTTVYVGNLGPIPIFIHWSAVILLLMAWQWGSGGSKAFGPAYILLFAIVLVLGILLHELGHALAARVQGAQGVRITLWAMGGLCSSARDSRPIREILILAAGPAVSFLLAGISWGLIWWLAQSHPAWLGESHRPSWLYLGLKLGYSLNLVLGIFNIFPIFPLDGGQIVHNVLKLITPKRANQITLTIGVVACAAVLAWQIQATGRLDMWTAVLMGSLLFNAFSYLR